MSPRTKITNDKFSVRICQIANSYGFKTIGKFHKFLKQCQPSAKLGLGIGHTRVATVLKEVNKELNQQPEQDLATLADIQEEAKYLQ